MKKCPFCAEEIQDAAVRCKHCSSWMTDERLLAEKAREIGSQKLDALKGFVGNVAKNIEEARRAEVERKKAEVDAQEFKIVGVHGWTRSGRAEQLRLLVGSEEKAGWDFRAYADRWPEGPALFSQRRLSQSMDDWDFKIVNVPMFGNALDRIRMQEEKAGWELAFFHKGNSDAAGGAIGLVTIPSSPVLGTLMMLLSAKKNERKGASRYTVFAAAFRRRKGIGA